MHDDFESLSSYGWFRCRVFEGGSYIKIFTISLFEFIIAQSPQSMKGVAIDRIYYTLLFGLVGLFLLAEYQTCDKYYPAHH